MQGNVFSVMKGTLVSIEASSLYLGVVLTAVNNKTIIIRNIFAQQNKNTAASKMVSRARSSSFTRLASPEALEALAKIGVSIAALFALKRIVIGFQHHLSMTRISLGSLRLTHTRFYFSFLQRKGLNHFLFMI